MIKSEVSLLCSMCNNSVWCLIPHRFCFILFLSWRFLVEDKLHAKKKRWNKINAHNFHKLLLLGSALVFLFGFGTQGRGMRFMLWKKVPPHTHSLEKKTHQQHKLILCIWRSVYAIINAWGGVVVVMSKWWSHWTRNQEAEGASLISGSNIPPI